MALYQPIGKQLMSFFTAYGIFVAKTFTIVVAIILVLIAMTAIRRQSKTREDSKLKITSLNEHYDELRDQLLSEMMDKKEWKAHKKAEKKAEKSAEKNEKPEQPRLFVLDFDGDIDASDVETLREHLTAIIQTAQVHDEVLLRLESGGGYVHSYGLAASQLARLKTRNIRLTIAVDKIAASGGYMMACVADELIAAPFAIIGSVGVIGAVPNFRELLEKNHIHYEQHTAGKHKRSLTVFGENTDEDRAQFQKELNETHTLFKAHIAQMRPQLDVESIATGETWYGSQALARGLIDRIETSDDYLLNHIKTHQIIELSEEIPETLMEKLKHKFLSKVQENVAAPIRTWIQ